MFYCFGCSSSSDAVRLPQFQCSSCGSDFVQRVALIPRLQGNHDVRPNFNLQFQPRQIHIRNNFPRSRRPQIFLNPTTGEITVADRQRSGVARNFPPMMLTPRVDSAEVTRRMGFLAITPIENATPEDKCSICISAFLPNMFKTSCGHYFHGRCIRRWLQEKNSCPICQTPVAPQ